MEKKGEPEQIAVGRVIFPSVHLNIPEGTRDVNEIEFQQADDSNIEEVLESFKVTVFEVNGDYFILVRDLGVIWNYPSSYHLVNKIEKGTGINKGEFLRKTNKELNKWLYEKEVIDKGQEKYSLFYILAKFLYRRLKNKEILVGDARIEETRTPEGTELNQDDNDDDIVTVAQVVPQLSSNAMGLELSYSNFSSLTRLSKLNFYKESPAYQKFIPNSKLFINEREQLYKENDLTSTDAKIPEQTVLEEPKEPRRGRKALGKPKKNTINIDPNTMNLSETIIPGQGFTQPFNLGVFNMVPSYFVTSTNETATSNNAPKRANASSLLLGDAAKVTRNIQGIVMPNNNYNESVNRSKYFYSKSHRSLGSGNFRDATTVQKVNKIPVTSNNKIKVYHKRAGDYPQTIKGRGRMSVKGLMYERFSKKAVRDTIKKQSEKVEDYENLEMLHSVSQLNFLLNSYRRVSESSWSSYFKFKQTDFAQLGMMKRRRTLKQNPDVHSHGDLAQRFVHPSFHQDILKRLPLELRHDDSQDTDEIPPIPYPLNYQITHPDTSNPELLNKVEIVQIPNANAIGWDNIRKMRLT